VKGFGLGCEEEAVAEEGAALPSNEEGDIAHRCVARAATAALASHQKATEAVLQALHHRDATI
jgi:hypothetical protein